MAHNNWGWFYINHSIKKLKLSLILAGLQYDRHNIGGFCIFLRQYLISLKSSKHRVVLRSSTKSNFHALTTIITKVMWIQKQLAESSIDLTKTPLIFYDNINFGFLVKNSILYSKSQIC